MNAYSSDLLIATVSADLTIQDGDSTYLCFLDNSAKKDPTIALEDQDIWRIIRIKKITLEGKKVYQRQYPDGIDSFGYAASKSLIYTYKFRK